MFSRLKKRMKNTAHQIVYDGLSNFYNANKHVCLNTLSQHVVLAYDDVCNTPLFTNTYAPTVNSDDKKRYYNKYYGLMDYHIDYFNTLTSELSLTGKNVLEIGGSNYPKELVINNAGAESWVCIDKPWHYNTKDSHNHYKQTPFKKFADTSLDNALVDSNYVIFYEYAEDMPENFFDKFDIVVSCCSFEHINALSTVLDLIYRSLKKGGVLHSHFGVPWSSANGNHIWIDDPSLSVKLTHDKWPVELNHCHLYMSYPEIYQYLSNHYCENVARKYSHLVKNGDFLNKYFYEDYMFLMHKASFESKSVSPLYMCECKKETMALLQDMYPGYSNFDVGGINIQAVK